MPEPRCAEAAWFVGGRWGDVYVRLVHMPHARHTEVPQTLDIRAKLLVHVAGVAVQESVHMEVPGGFRNLTSSRQAAPLRPGAGRMAGHSSALLDVHTPAAVNY